MSAPRNGPTPEDRAQLGAAGIAAGLGCSVVATLVALIGGGVLLDGALDTSPIFTLIGVAVGLAAAGYQLWELTRVGLKDRPPGPLGRQMARLPAARGSGTRTDPGRRGNGEE